MYLLYVYICAWRERRKDSIPLRGVIREKRWENERATETEKEIPKWKKKVARTTRHDPRFEEEGEEKGEALLEKGHWDARNESLLVVAMGSRTAGSSWDEGSPCSNEGKGCEDQSVREPGRMDGRMRDAPQASERGDERIRSANRAARDK
ncbi:unnamed protein product [Lasius platythorax]|uniref:Uncharacterized protein n=1 Tax=Lasius platythorax TaxID=488582 RepID=A0AAV2NHA9_9HYME